MFERRVTLVVGHFGSGKTEIALNGALRLADSGVSVTLVDLDVVKPYFRSRSARTMLSERGVELIIPSGENVFADLPIIVPRIRGALRDGEQRVIIDVGGDDTGARVLGSLADVMPTDDIECLLVLNFRRPGTRDAEDALEMIRRIEIVSRVRVSGLVSNTHLMDETTPAVVEEGFRLAAETGRRAGVPVVAVTVPGEVADRLDPEAVALGGMSCPIIPLERIVKPPFELAPPERRIRGPLFVLS